MKSFQDIDLKEEYHADEDDIISDFFAPCLGACTEYDRCIEYISVDMLRSTFTEFDNFKNGTAKLRIITSHSFRPKDLDTLTPLLSKSKNPLEKRGIKDEGLLRVRRAFESGQFQIKIAISEIPTGENSFNKLGIFKDGHGNAITYISTSRRSFGAMAKQFESIDVFTSWNDSTRVKSKLEQFEQLWLNKMPHMDVHKFEYAARDGHLKYWTEWIMQE